MPWRGINMGLGGTLCTKMYSFRLGGFGATPCLYAMPWRVINMGLGDCFTSCGINAGLDGVGATPCLYTMPWHGINMGLGDCFTSWDLVREHHVTCDLVSCDVNPPNLIPVFSRSEVYRRDGGEGLGLLKGLGFGMDKVWRDGGEGRIGAT